MNKEKIGQLMVYLAEQIPSIYHTKLIKMLYLIDEEAVKDDGIPVTWLDYKAWQYGPVAPDTYLIKCGGMEFSAYVEAVRIDETSNKYIIHPKVPFSDGKFSDYEMEIIDRTIEKYGSRQTSELVALTHRKGSLWDITKTENRIVFDDYYRISDYSLDFRKLIADDLCKLENYQEAKEILLLNGQLN